MHVYCFASPWSLLSCQLAWSEQISSEVLHRQRKSSKSTFKGFMCWSVSWLEAVTSCWPLFPVFVPSQIKATLCNYSTFKQQLQNRFDVTVTFNSVSSVSVSASQPPCHWHKFSAHNTDMTSRVLFAVGTHITSDKLLLWDLNLW